MYVAAVDAEVFACDRWELYIRNIIKITAEDCEARSTKGCWNHSYWSSKEKIIQSNTFYEESSKAQRKR